jgi:hypothetical protein
MRLRYDDVNKTAYSVFLGLTTPIAHRGATAAQCAALRNQMFLDAKAAYRQNSPRWFPQGIKRERGARVMLAMPWLPPQL